jgi:hypothetical protein
MSWSYQTSVKSLSDMDSLVHDVLRAPDFDAVHDAPNHPISDGWQESTVKIRLPRTRTRFENEDSPEVFRKIVKMMRYRTT